MPDTKTYYSIGLMSGSSLDGLDIAYCKIEHASAYTFQFLEAETIPFTIAQKEFLRNIPIDPARNYNAESIAFGKIIAASVKQFIIDNTIDRIDFIASHGHTLFHFPEKGITSQIGDGQVLADATGKRVSCNFRQADVDAGGQGAPLVPIADELFFNNRDACLNIGGIANISFKQKGLRIGFDICAANQLLNACAQEMHLEFDAGGNAARNGVMDKELLDALNRDLYFESSFPKSLDNNWIKGRFLKLLKNATLSPENKLATATEHIAIQISRVIEQQIIESSRKKKEYNLLITGGGAFNTYLIERIEELSDISIALPEKTLIGFKEALAMCLMGVLRMEGVPNFIPSVTGARFAVCGGDMYEPSER